MAEHATYIAKVYRQHNSMVMTIPKGVVNSMNIDHGDVLGFVVNEKESECKIVVIVKKMGKGYEGRKDKSKGRGVRRK